MQVPRTARVVPDVSGRAPPTSETCNAKESRAEKRQACRLRRQDGDGRNREVDVVDTGVVGVDRVAEGVTPGALTAALDSATLGLGQATQSNPPESANPAAVTATSSNIAAVEEGVGIPLGLAAPGGGGSLQVTVTQVPAIGQIVTLPTETCAGARQIQPISEAISTGSRLRSRSAEPGSIVRPALLMLWG